MTSEDNLYFNSIDDDFEEFVNKYPDIKDYFSLASKEQLELETKGKAHMAEVNSKRDKVTFLN